MTEPLHPMFRSERQFAWVLQMIVIAGLVGLLVVDITRGDDAGQFEIPTKPDPEISAPTPTSPVQVPSSEAPSNETPPAEATISKRSFTLVATGDIISHGAVAQRAASAAEASGIEGWDFRPLFQRIKPILTGADLALCHLESPLSLNDDDLSFRGTFRVPSSLADAIVDAGYDGCSLASNHALDSGTSSVASTLHHMRRVGLAATGMADTADASGPAWFTPGGIRVAHFSVTDLINGRDLPIDPPWMVPHLDVGQVTADARTAKTAGAEFVIVSVHWGEEYRADPTVRQRAVAEHLLNAPEVDLVLGHHAHVVQPVAQRDGDAVVFGLGNLLTNQPGDEANPCSSCPPETQDGLIAWFQISDEPGLGVRIIDIGYTPTWVNRTETHEVVPIGVDDPDQVDPMVLAGSAARTAAMVEPDLRLLDFTAG
ncbi:MAG: CapA family protein [Acidimicrobiales bacterium]|nr:CapA family protein [Acidimicrobiales bacterium]